jgi:hypothetical protein
MYVLVEPHSNKLVHLTESAARPIERLILEMCRQSLHVGLVTYFNLNASLTDNIEAIVVCKEEKTLARILALLIVGLFLDTGTVSQSG